MAKKDKTLENLLKVEKRTAVKTMIDDFHRYVVGSSLIDSRRSKYGELALPSADEFMNGKDVKAYKDKIYKKNITGSKREGAYGKPDYPSSNAISRSILASVGIKMVELTVGELESVVREISSELDYEVPENLRDYNIKELGEKAEASNANGKDLSEEEVDAFIMYDSLRDFYMNAAVKEVSSQSYFAGARAMAEPVLAKYRPKKEANGDDKTEGDEK